LKSVQELSTPAYPVSVRQVAYVTGTVEIGLAISPHGDVGNAHVLTGHPMLVTSALEAIRQWQFQPNVVQGKPTWSRMRALVRFSADGTTAVAFAPPLLADSFGDPGPAVMSFAKPRHRPSSQKPAESRSPARYLTGLAS
jgi:TonB family protein